MPHSISVSGRFVPLNFKLCLYSSVLLPVAAPGNITVVVPSKCCSVLLRDSLLCLCNSYAVQWDLR